MRVSALPCLHWRRRRRTPGRIPPVGREQVWSRRGSFLPGSRHCLLFLGKTRRTRLKWMRHRPRPCSAGHLASPRRVVNPESSWPGTATSVDWFSGPDDLSWPPRISLDSEEVELDAGDEPTSVEEDSLVDVTVPPSFQMVACSVALEDISKLLLEVPSTQPRRRRTVSLRSSLLSSWGPRTQRSRLCCQHCCASSHHLDPGCRQKCCRPLVSLGDQWTMPGRPCSPTGTHHGVSYPSSSIALHFGGYGAVAPGGSVPCANTTVIG